MKNFLKKTLNKYYNFLEKKSVQKSLEYLINIWLGLIFFLYIYYRGYADYLYPIFIFLFLLVLLLNFKYNPKTKISQLLQKIIFNLKIKINYKIKIIDLFWLIPAFLIFIANTLLLTYFYQNNFSFNDLLFYELNIIQKIILLSLFYEVFAIFVYGIGRKILNFFKLQTKTKPELFIFSLGLGFIPLFFGVFLLSVFSLIYAWSLLIFLIFLLFVAKKEIQNILKEFQKDYFSLSFSSPQKIFHFFVVLILFLFLSLNFVSIIKPSPTDSDSLHSYFNVPDLISKNHKYTTVPSIGHANMGQNQEMIYVLILSLFSPFFIIHISFFFFVLYLMVFYFLIKNFLSKKYADLAILLIFFIPINTFFVHTVKVDFALLFYLSLSLYLFFVFLENFFKNNTVKQPLNTKQALYLLGIFLGVAMGIKYNAVLLIIPIFFLLFVFFLFFQKRKNFLKEILISLFLLFLFFSPWLIKNIFYFQKPLYPYNYFSFTNNNFQNYFYADKDFQNYKHNRSKEIHLLKHANYLDNLSFLNFFKTIWQQSIGKNVLGDASSNFGFLASLLFPFLFFIKLKRNELILSILTILYFGIWYLSKGGGAWYAMFGHIMLYALLPIIIFKYKKTFYPILIITLFIGILHTYFWGNELNYLIGKENKNTYINKAVPYYELAQYINKLKLNNKEKILLIGDFKLSYIDKNDKIIKDVDVYFTKTGYNLNKGEEFFYKLLKKENIKYIIHSNFYTTIKTWPKQHKMTIQSYQENLNQNTPDIYTDINRFHAFLKKYASLAFDNKCYQLYKLK